MKECTKLVQCSSDKDDGEDSDDEDVDALLATLDQQIDQDSRTSVDEKVVAKLMIKVKAFVSKVRFFPR